MKPKTGNTKILLGWNRGTRTTKIGLKESVSSKITLFDKAEGNDFGRRC